MASIVVRISGVPKGSAPKETKKRRTARTFPVTKEGSDRCAEFAATLDRVEQTYYVRSRVNGAPRSKRFRTPSAARRYKVTLEADKLQGRVIDPKWGRVPLSDHANKWLEGRRDLKPTTRSKYRGLLDRHILPILGSERIGDITSEQIRVWYYELRGRLAPTAEDAYRLLHTIFSTAVTDKKVPENPCSVKGAGRIRSPERPVGSVSDLAAATVVVPENWLTAVLLAVWCSMRRGEILGLQRQDVNLVEHRLTVARAWVKPERGEAYVSSPKSDASWRTIQIPNHVIPYLSTHLEGMHSREPTAWLFPGKGGDLPVKPRQFDRVWSAVREAIGRSDLHLHDLRHTGLTWVAATGATTADIMRRGGHSTTSAALRYQHSSAARDRQIADALSQLAATEAATPRIEPRQKRAKKSSEAPTEGAASRFQIADVNIGRKQQRAAPEKYRSKTATPDYP